MNESRRGSMYKEYLPIRKLSLHYALSPQRPLAMRAALIASFGGLENIISLTPSSLTHYRGNNTSLTRAKDSSFLPRFYIPCESDLPSDPWYTIHLPVVDIHNKVGQTPKLPFPSVEIINRAPASYTSPPSCPRQYQICAAFY